MLFGKLVGLGPVAPSPSTHYPSYLKKRVVLEQQEPLVGYAKLPGHSCHVGTQPIQADVMNLHAAGSCPEFPYSFSSPVQVSQLDDVELPVQTTC